MLNKKLMVVMVVLAVVMAVCCPAYAWKFVSMADSRGDNNGVNTTELTRIVNQINTEGADLVLFQGDAVTGGCDDTCLSSQMDTWLAIMNTLNCPWYYCPGNHEIYSSTSENVLRTKVNQPTNGPVGHEEMVYSFDYLDAHFVSLNSNHYGEVHHVQRTWLATDLAATTQPHVFVMGHEPAYPSGPHIGSSLDYYPTERDDFWNIMTTGRVGMYLTGHEHLYQRSKQGAIYQVINGSCGAPLHTGYTGTLAVYHYVVVEIDGNNVTATCKDDTGAVLDTWSYVANTGAITGNIKNAANQNVWGATVSTDTGGYTATTDNNGNYTLSDVTAGTYSVTASKMGYVTQTQTGKTVLAGQTTGVNFTLQTGQQSQFPGVLNGNFEGGSYNDPDASHAVANNWTKFVSAGSPQYNVPSLTTWHGGSYGQAMFGANWTMGIYQQASSAVVGLNYTAKVWVKATDNKVKFWVGIDPYGGTNPASANVQWSAESIPSATWTQITKQVAAQATTITMFIKAQNTAKTSKYGYVDDAELIEEGAVPPSGTISGSVKDTNNVAISGATVSTNLGGYSTTSDASGNYTLANVQQGTYNVTASRTGYAPSTQTGQVVYGNQTTTVNFSLTAQAYIAAEDFEVMPTWTSSFDAPWGSAATLSIVTGGQSGYALQANRTSQGSSAKVKVFTVPQNSTVTVSVYMKCPSYANSYWVECACKLGSNTAQDFDANSGTWTYIKKFSDTGTNGNGNVWTQYSVTVNTGTSTQLSVGFKHGSSGYVGPTACWDSLLIQ